MALAVHTAANRLPGKEKAMAKVMIPTVVGFVSLMGLWGISVATYMM